MRGGKRKKRHFKIIKHNRNLIKITMQNTNNKVKSDKRLDMEIAFQNFNLSITHTYLEYAHNMNDICQMSDKRLQVIYNAFFG